MDDKSECFFCSDCDAAQCEDAVLSKLRNIAAQAGKRQWWNVMHTINELNAVALKAMHRDINAAAASVRKVTP